MYVQTLNILLKTYNIVILFCNLDDSQYKNDSNLKTLKDWTIKNGLFTDLTNNEDEDKKPNQILKNKVVKKKKKNTKKKKNIVKKHQI